MVDIELLKIETVSEPIQSIRQTKLRRLWQVGRVVLLATILTACAGDPNEGRSTQVPFPTMVQPENAPTPIIVPAPKP